MNHINNINSAMRLQRNDLRSFTLIESVISTVIVGVMFVAAMNVLGATAIVKRITEQQAFGNSLAQDLMNEILNQPYEDQVHKAKFGLEAGEVGTDRADFNDVDDYASWSASPPEDKDGTQLSEYDKWTRSVEVVKVRASDFSKIDNKDNVKRITVTVSHRDKIATQLTAIRTPAWPIGRTDPGIIVLFIVTDPSIPTKQESEKKSLMEAWGFTVNLFRASTAQATLDTATASANIAYVSTEIDDEDLKTKLRDTLIGVVNEEEDLGLEFGFAGMWAAGSSKDLNIVDNSHYITDGLSIGLMQILNTSQQGHMLSGSVAPGLQTLGRSWDSVASTYRRSLAVIETGGELYSGGEFAMGRRVSLPWGRLDFKIGELNKNGLEILRRSIEWAAGKERL